SGGGCRRRCVGLDVGRGFGGSVGGDLRGLGLDALRLAGGGRIGGGVGRRGVRLGGCSGRGFGGAALVTGGGERGGFVGGGGGGGRSDGRGLRGLCDLNKGSRLSDRR